MDLLDAPADEPDSEEGSDSDVDIELLLLEPDLDMEGDGAESDRDANHVQLPPPSAEKVLQGFTELAEEFRANLDGQFMLTTVDELEAQELASLANQLSAQDGLGSGDILGPPDCEERAISAPGTLSPVGRLANVAVSVLRRSSFMLESSGLVLLGEDPGGGEGSASEDDDGLGEEESRLSIQTRDLHRRLGSMDLNDMVAAVHGPSGVVGGTAGPDGKSSTGPTLMAEHSRLLRSLSQLADEYGDVPITWGARSGARDVTDGPGQLEEIGQAPPPSEERPSLWGDETSDIPPNGTETPGGGPGRSRGGSAQKRAAAPYDPLRDSGGRPPPRDLTPRRQLSEALRHDVRHLPDFNECTLAHLLGPEELAQIYFGLVPVSSQDPDMEPLCTFMLECCVRPDMPAGTILAAVTRAATDHGLELRRRRGTQVLLAVEPLGSPSPHKNRRRGSLDPLEGHPGNRGDWGPWSFVDMQLVVSRHSRHRVLIARFLLSRPTRDRERDHPELAEAASWLSAPAVVRTVDDLKMALIGQQLALGALLKRPASDTEVQLDEQFVRQVEAMCRKDMSASLKETGQGLERHAREAERVCDNLLRLLEPMYELFGLPVPVFVGRHLPDLDLGPDMEPSSTLGGSELCDEDVKELSERQYGNEGDRVMALVVARWARCVARCDGEMTQRVQKKNTQVLERIGAAKLYARELLQTLRDSEEVLRHRSSEAFHRQMDGKAKMDPGLEAPLFYCGVVSGGRPGYLYLTYWNLCLHCRVPPFGSSVKIVALDLIRDVTTTKRVVGGYLEVRKEGEERPTYFSPTVVPLDQLRDLILTLAKQIHEEPGDMLHESDSLYDVMY